MASQEAVESSAAVGDFVRNERFVRVCFGRHGDNRRSIVCSDAVGERDSLTRSLGPAMIGIRGEKFAPLQHTPSRSSDGVPISVRLDEYTTR